MGVIFYDAKPDKSWKAELADIISFPNTKQGMLHRYQYLQEKDGRSAYVMNIKRNKITKILPIIDYSEEYSCFICRDKTYMDILKVQSKDLDTLDDSQIQLDILDFLKLYRTYAADMKIVGMNFPVDTSSQQRNINLIKKRTENTIFMEALDEELTELEQVQENFTEREYYLFIYADRLEDLNDRRSKIRVLLERNGMYALITQQKKEQILRKINNPNSRIDLSLSHSSKEAVSAEEIKKLGFNPHIVEAIQPCGNLNFNSDDRVIKTGDGYMSCIYVHKLEENLSLYWLSRLVNINNVITVVDINTQTDTAEVTKNINKSIDEQLSRAELAKNASEKVDANRRVSELTLVYNELSSMGEIIKNIRIRIFVAANTYVGLEEQVANIQTELDALGYKCSVNLNESEYEWQSIFYPYGKQEMFPNTRPGIPVFSETLAGGHPFHFSSLLDNSGVYYGRTDSTGGAVLWDMFLKSPTRNYYNAVVAGTMSSGKSTILKKIFKARACKGDFIRGFDVSDEWSDLVRTFGGKIISLDGTDDAMVLNPWQVLKTAENESACFKEHISKLRTIYKFLKPTADDSELFLFENCASQLYVNMGLVNLSSNSDIDQITGLPATSYPRSRDFVSMLENILNQDYNNLDTVQQAVKIEELKHINDILIVFKNLVNNYGTLFDGYSTVEDMLNEQIVFFNIKKLVNFSSEVFDAQMYSALSLCYDNCVKIGSVMKNEWESGNIEWQDITRFLIICDEAHRFVNANKITAVDQLIVFEREARKFFGGIIFASQSIHDFVPEEAGTIAVGKIRTLFELCQYKILLKQDANAIKDIKRIFDGELTEQEVKDIPSFETGQCILCMGNKQNIRYHIYLSPEDNALFKGGA